MIIGLCLKENSETSVLDNRFGRAGWFAICDSDKNNEITIIENMAKEQSGGAGSMAVQTLSDHKVEILIAPEVGPKAFPLLNTLKIEILKQGENKTITEVLSAWKEGKLSHIQNPGAMGLHKA